MKINYRRSSHTRHRKPLFVAISKFDAASFPVPVRHLQLRATNRSESLENAGDQSQPVIPQCLPQTLTSPMNVVAKPLDLARRIARQACALF